MQRRLLRSLALILLTSPAFAGPLGTAFTFQGRLMQSGTPAEGSYPMDFALFDVADGGAPLATLHSDAVAVTGGLFTVELEFGDVVFDGTDRWLEITVDGETLSPRQALTAAPHALWSANAGAAAGVPWSGITGVPDNVLNAYSPWTEGITTTGPCVA